MENTICPENIYTGRHERLKFKNLQQEIRTNRTILCSYGKEFLTLTDKEIKTMVPPIGLAYKLFRLLPPDKEVCVCIDGM